MPLHNLTQHDARPALALVPAAIPVGALGAVARLVTPLSSAAFSLREGHPDVSIDTDGIVRLASALAAGDRRSFTARAHNGSGDAVERRFELVAATSAPLFAAIALLPRLATSGAHYHVVLSNTRLIADSGGPLVEIAGGSELGRASDAVSPEEIALRRDPRDAVRVTRWFDQTGGARHLAARNVLEQPALREDVLIGGVPAMAFDGIRGGDGRGAQVRRLFGDLALSMTDATIVTVIDPTVSVQEQYYWEVRTPGDATTALGHLQYPHAQFGGALPDNSGGMTISSGAFRGTGHKLATVPQVVAIRLSPTATEIFVDGIRVAQLPAATTGTGAGFALGGPADLDGIEAYIPTWRCAAWIAIDRAVLDADVAAVTATLAQRFDLSTADGAVVVDIGTSRVAGGSNSTVSRNKAWFERGLFGASRVRTYNLGQDGTSLSYAYADRAGYAAALYRPDVPIVYVIDDAINDLGGLGASSDPQAIAAMLTDFVAALHALGPNVRVVVATTLPQAAGAYARGDAAVDADRQALNALIRANAMGADAISDPASDATMGGYPAGPNDLALYSDRLHPSSAGYAMLAPYNVAATSQFVPGAS